MFLNAPPRTMNAPPRPPNAEGLEFRVDLRTPSVSDFDKGNALARMKELEDNMKSGRGVAEAQRETARLKQVMAGSQLLITTTTQLVIGETVVVGTSRVQGEKALVMLLTAVPR